jgi:predicted  nucleic acid-binding Zn-ribbon protein
VWSYLPHEKRGLIPVESIKVDTPLAKANNITLAFDVAKKELECTILLDVEDVGHERLSMVTALNQLHLNLEHPGKTMSLDGTLRDRTPMRSPTPSVPGHGGEVPQAAPVAGLRTHGSGSNLAPPPNTGLSRLGGSTPSRETSGSNHPEVRRLEAKVREMEDQARAKAKEAEEALRKTNSEVDKERLRVMELESRLSSGSEALMAVDTKRVTELEQQLSAAVNKTRTLEKQLQEATAAAAMQAKSAAAPSVTSSAVEREATRLAAALEASKRELEGANSRVEEAQKARKELADEVARVKAATHPVSSPAKTSAQEKTLAAENERLAKELAAAKAAVAHGHHVKHTSSGGGRFAIVALAFISLGLIGLRLYESRAYFGL